MVRSGRLLHKLVTLAFTLALTGTKTLKRVKKCIYPLPTNDQNHILLTSQELVS